MPKALQGKSAFVTGGLARDRAIDCPPGTIRHRARSGPEAGAFDADASQCNPPSAFHAGSGD
jgi:hypothetical protein